MSVERPKLNALTLLRFVAAALVVLYHFQYTFLTEKAFAPFDFSQCVSFFFILSGFILAHVHPKLPADQAPRFWLARVARIWPLHLVTLLLTCLLLPERLTETLAEPDSGLIILANLFMVHAWVPVQKYFFSLNLVSWSISTEFAFYLCFPWLIRNFEKTWAVKLVGALALTLAILWLCDLSGLPRFNERQISVQGWAYISPLARGFEFVLGMALSLLYRHLAPRYQVGFKLATLVELLALALVVTTMYETNALVTLLSSLKLVGVAGAFYLSFSGVTQLSFAALILVMALGRGALSKALSHPLPVRLGEISYSVYLLHMVLLLYQLYPIRLKPNIPAVTGVDVALYWLLLLLGAYALWRWVEKPAQNWMLRSFGRLNPPRFPQSNPQPTS